MQKTKKIKTLLAINSKHNSIQSTNDSPEDDYLDEVTDNFLISMKESIDAFILEEVIKKA